MISEAFFSLPARALANFESWSDLTITIHDYENSLSLYLPQHRFVHCAPWCLAVKKAGFDRRCVNLEMTQLVRRQLRHLEPSVHVCHAGLVEWSVPVMREDKLAWMFFAGQRRLGRATLPGLYLDRSPQNDVLDDQELPLPSTTVEMSEQIGEGLCQLAARLICWREQVSEALSDRKIVDRSRRGQRLQIERFIYGYHEQPIGIPDLAQRLGLSESRTSHLVRELCGRGFMEMLTEARVRTAAGLLRHTQLSIGDVATSSGFRDYSNFHRVFKRHMNQSAREYRRAFKFEQT